MSTISPALNRAFWLLCNEIYERLDAAEHLGDDTIEWTVADAENARDVIGDLIELVRSVVVEHQAGPDGECPCCLQRWPCRTVALVYQVATDPARRISELSL